MSHSGGLGGRSLPADEAQVEEAERKVGAVLEALEENHGVEVKHIDLEEVVDTDGHGQPVVKKSVDIRVERRPKKGWVR